MGKIDGTIATTPSASATGLSRSTVAGVEPSHREHGSKGTLPSDRSAPSPAGVAPGACHLTAKRPVRAATPAPVAIENTMSCPLVTSFGIVTLLSTVPLAVDWA